MARTFAALIVDSDLKGLESLVYGFQGVDWRSTACPAPEVAGLLVKASGADILVVATREPHDKTLTLLRQLRSSEESRPLPVLVIGPAGLRASVLDCGQIDFLPTPVFVRDVISASRIIISLGKQAADKPGGEPVIEGALADFGLLSIIRVMSGLRRSGVLQVARANHRGEILFSEGEIAGAQVGSLQGPPAIHRFLLWDDAKVELRLRAVTRRAQFNQRLDQVMDEAERFVRDYNHAIQGIGPTSSVYAKNDARLKSATVPSEVAPALRLCDGRRTLTDIVDDSPFRVFDTVRILARLVDLGVLTRRMPQDAVSAPVPPLQKFWETARIAGPDDRVAPGPAPRPTPARVGQIDNRIAEPNRRKMQRRISALTPIQGTPFVGMEAAETPASGTPEIAPEAASGAQVTHPSRARASGSIDLRATGDRRQGNPDRRTRPSVTIDAALVEAATLPAPATVPVDTPAAPAAPAARTGRITGTLQVAPSSGHRRPGTAHASGGISVEIDPELASEVHLTAQADSPAAPLDQSIAPVATPKATKTGTTPAPLGVTTAPLGQVASVVVGHASASSHAAAAAPAASGSVSAAAGDGSRSARVTGTLSVTPSQRSAVNKTPAQSASVQLDPVLMAELGRLEKATTPVGPPDSAEPLQAGPAPAATRAPDAASAAPAVESPASSPSKPSQGARATGTFSISPSSRSSANALKPPQSGLSVALDPALVAEAKKLDAPKSRPAVASGRGSTGAAEPRTGSQGTTSGKSPTRAASSEGPAARPTARASDESHREAAPPGRPSGRISGTFNDVERDFFAREADLYKRETEDNFADLDEPASRGAKRNSSGRGPSKKRA
jgi:hypothetical protein